MKQFLYLLVMSLYISSCTASNTALLGEANITKITNDTDPTIFLLERDIPQNINRLGTVAIPLVVNTYTLKRIDNDVKRKLKELCKTVGANGAYRINDGTYSPYTISYLLFHYNK